MQPYYFRNRQDSEMDEIYQTVCDVVETGSSDHTAYRIGRNRTQDEG